MKCNAWKCDRCGKTLFSEPKKIALATGYHHRCCAEDESHIEFTTIEHCPRCHNTTKRHLEKYSIFIDAGGYPARQEVVRKYAPLIYKNAKLLAGHNLDGTSRWRDKP